MVSLIPGWDVSAHVPIMWYFITVHSGNIFFYNWIFFICENLMQQRNWVFPEYNESSVSDVTETTHLQLKEKHAHWKHDCQPVFSLAGLLGDKASWKNPVVLLPNDLICHRKAALHDSVSMKEVKKAFPGSVHERVSVQHEREMGKWSMDAERFQLKIFVYIRP